MSMINFAAYPSFSYNPHKDDHKKYCNQIPRVWYAFNVLQLRLCSAPIQNIPDFTTSFITEMDISAVSVGEWKFGESKNPTARKHLPWNVLKQCL